MQNIRRKYKYNHVHDDVSFANVLKELADANSVHKLKDTPAPTQGSANAVVEQLKKLSNLFRVPPHDNYKFDSETSEVTSVVSDSSCGTRSSRKSRKSHRSRKDKDKNKTRSSSRGTCSSHTAKVQATQTAIHVRYMIVNQTSSGFTGLQCSVKQARRKHSALFQQGRFAEMLKCTLK